MSTDTVEGSAAANQQKSLVEQVSELLAKAGHGRPTDWVKGVHPDVHVTQDEGVQRFLINRYWRVQLGALAIDTMDVRYCLVDTGEISRWLSLFEQGVVPCVVENNLPPAVH